MNQTEIPLRSNPPDAAERRRLLEEWNTTELDLPRVGLIHEVIEQRASETPNAVALVCRDRQLSYSELNARADQLASHLRELGAGSEKLVGLCLDRSLEMMIGLLGILKSGAAYVPLDPTYPKERIAFMLEDSKPLAVITQTSLRGVLPKPECHLLCVDNFDWAPTSTNSRTSEREEHSHALAYVIYTSGSTGKPKGVMVEHRNVLNFFAAMDSRVPFNAGATWLAVTSPSFDISVLELFWTLSRGFKVIIYAEATGAESGGPRHRQGLDSSMPDLIERHGVTHLQCTPSMTSMLLLDERTQKAIGRLQTLLIGGEAFPVKLARQLREVFAGTLLNMYGPTETTVWSTTYQVPAGPDIERVPIGRPIANTQVYIVDEQLQPVAIGANGELLIGGAGVARGYLGREQLTAERFIANPFANGGRLYRTGDVARYLPDGNIELLGRIDQQIKIRGHRVELGEIEAVLNEHPTVREAVVLLKEFANDEKNLVAYIIPQEGHTPTLQQLRQHAAQALPEHMRPSHVMLMAAFPQTPNKKIDRNAFPAPEPNVNDAMAAGASRDQKEPEQPETEVEKALTAMWMELLALSRVGRQDNFFECGGHSMLAMQLVARVRKRFKVDFPLKNVFERQTLGAMADAIEALLWSQLARTPRAGPREVVDV